MAAHPSQRNLPTREEVDARCHRTVVAPSVSGAFRRSLLMRPVHRVLNGFPQPLNRASRWESHELFRLDAAEISARRDRNPRALHDLECKFPTVRNPEPVKPTGASNPCIERAIRHDRHHRADAFEERIESVSTGLDSMSPCLVRGGRLSLEAGRSQQAARPCWATRRTSAQAARSREPWDRAPHHPAQQPPRHAGYLEKLLMLLRS